MPHGQFDNYTLAKRYNAPQDVIGHLVYEFNNSEHIKSLPAYADSRHYVSKLAKEGFRFTVITSLSGTDRAKEYRTYNLENLFGPVFDNIICLDPLASKKDVLSRWKNTGLFWIEDHEVNAVDGAKLGLKSILIDQSYNRSEIEDGWKLHSRTSHGTPWKDIYNTVMLEYADVCTL